MISKEKKYGRSHIGEVHITKESLGGYECKIVNGGSVKGHCTILIGKVIKEVPYIRICSGAVRYEYHPSVFGVGFLGEGDNTMKVKGIRSKSYQIWHCMLQRCYDNKTQEKRPTYKNIVVCEEWHNYQNFTKWFKENYVEGWHLDKDLLLTGAGMYSPNTCVFIPQALNNFLTNNQTDNTSGYTGVSWRKGKGKWLAHISSRLEGRQICLGSFNTKEEAAKAYNERRKVYAEEWKQTMAGKLSMQALEAIQ